MCVCVCLCVCVFVYLVCVLCVVCVCIMYVCVETPDDSSKPNVLRCIYFNISLRKVDQSKCRTLDLPRNLYVTSDPDDTIGYENAVEEVS